ncbi:MAG: LPS assembly lipoprotein LptE [Pirellulaceae bacterium]
MALRWLVAVAGVTLVTGCAGYQMGNRSLYRTDLSTVYVPIFQSDSLRPDLGEWMTEAVVKEIELRTPYKVVSNPLADSVLTGRILWDNKRVISENVNDEPRILIFNLAVHITWIDNCGRILAQSVITLGDNFVPEAGQSITSVEAVVIRRLASQIVSEMEAENW